MANGIADESSQREQTPEGNKQKLNKLLEKTHRLLLTISSVFPFDFFPNKIVIDENKVDVIEKFFFFSGRSHSILLKNIKNVFVDVGLLFATLKITEDDYPENPIKISYLVIKDAIKAKRIIQGLLACEREKIDLSTIEDKDLAGKIEEIGKAHEEKEQLNRAL